MRLHLETVVVPRNNVKKLLGAGAKVLKNLEEETGKSHSHSSLHCNLRRWCVHARFPFESFVGLTEKSKKE